MIYAKISDLGGAPSPRCSGRQCRSCSKSSLRGAVSGDKFTDAAGWIYVWDYMTVAMAQTLGRGLDPDLGNGQLGHRSKPKPPRRLTC